MSLEAPLGCALQCFYEILSPKILPFLCDSFDSASTATVRCADWPLCQLRSGNFPPTSAAATANHQTGVENSMEVVQRF